MDNLHDTAYQTSGLAQNVYGSKANIKAITRDDLVNYAKTYFVGPRVAIAGAGAVQQAQVRCCRLAPGVCVNVCIKLLVVAPLVVLQLAELADKYFGKLASASPAGYAAKVDKAVVTGSEIRVRVRTSLLRCRRHAQLFDGDGGCLLRALQEDTIPNAHMAIAFETGGWTDKYFFPLLVLQTLLGEWSCTSSFGADVYSPLARVRAGAVAVAAAPLVSAGVSRHVVCFPVGRGWLASTLRTL